MAPTTREEFRAFFEPCFFPPPFCSDGSTSVVGESSLSSNKGWSSWSFAPALAEDFALLFAPALLFGFGPGFFLGGFSFSSEPIFEEDAGDEEDTFFFAGGGPLSDGGTFSSSFLTGILLLFAEDESPPPGVLFATSFFAGVTGGEEEEEEDAAASDPLLDAGAEDAAAFPEVSSSQGIGPSFWIGRAGRG